MSLGWGHHVLAGVHFLCRVGLQEDGIAASQVSPASRVAFDSGAGLIGQESSQSLASVFRVDEDVGQEATVHLFVVLHDDGTRDRRFRVSHFHRLVGRSILVVIQKQHDVEVRRAVSGILVFLQTTLSPGRQGLQFFTS